jgi:hypothetical protein
MRPLVLALPVLVALGAPAFADDPTVNIDLKDHQFMPGEVPVPAGVKVKLLVKNDQEMTASSRATACTARRSSSQATRSRSMSGRSTLGVMSSSTISTTPRAAI